MNTRKRKSPSIKFVIKMLVWMLIGGILGFAMSWFGGQTERAGQFFAVVVRSVQSAMIPLVALVTVSGILFGEIVLKKIKQIEEKLRHAEDEECDELEYQEEYIGAWGVNQCHLLKEGIAKTFNKHSINIMSSDILKISLEFHGDLFFQYMSLSQFLCLFFGMKNRKSYFRVTLIKVSKNTLFASYFSEIGLYYLRAVTL